jgi:hypothetical protein
MTEKNNTGNEQAVRALHDFLDNYYRAHRHWWEHEFPRSEFRQGEDYAITGLVLIPKVRSALDIIDKGTGAALEDWHGVFESMRESKPRESQ